MHQSQIKHPDKETEPARSASDGASLSLSPPILVSLSGGLVLLCGFLFFHRLGERDLWSSHEARAAMDAQSLLEPGSTGWPRLHDGRMEVQKPPLFYWLVAAFARCGGGEVDALAVRLPAALAAAGTVLLVGLGVGVGFGRPGAGLLAALFLATGIHFPWLARIGRIDMPLTFTVTLAGGAFLLACRSSAGGRGRVFDAPVGASVLPGLPKTPAPATLPLLLVAYLACAAGVLLKGPIGLALPAAIVAAMLLLEGRWPAFWEVRRWGALVHELGVWWGVPLVLLVVVPVLAWAEHASGGQFGREFLWHHNVQRALGGSRLRGHPWFWYGPYFLLYFLPYSPFVLLALALGRWRPDTLARSALAWTIGVILLLSCARFKRADYLLPAYPGAAVFLACMVEACLASARRRLVLAGVVLLGGVMTVGWAVRLGWSLPGEEAYRDYRPFAAAVRERAPAPATVVLFQTEAHALAFRVGRPLTILLEWSQLQAHVERPGPHYLVMPPEQAAQCPHFLPGIHLEEVSRNTHLAGGKHERPLVLVCARAAAR
jgi:4-amino-4-deoxy-L-arabinose transferase-like glycosyltransferase